MEKSFENIPQKNQNEQKKKLNEELENFFAEAEEALKTEGREKAKGYLEKIYDDIILLNKRDKEDWGNTWVWNSEGDLKEDEFNALNLRRKLLSNEIGIMTSSGEIRHNLNEI